MKVFVRYRMKHEGVYSEFSFKIEKSTYRFTKSLQEAMDHIEKKYAWITEEMEEFYIKLEDE